MVRCELIQNSEKGCQRFDSVRNPPFSGLFTARTLQDCHDTWRSRHVGTETNQLRRQNGIFLRKRNHVRSGGGSLKSRRVTR